MTEHGAGSSSSTQAVAPQPAEVAIVQPSASYSIVMRVRLPQRPGSFGHVATAIGETGAILGAIDLVRVERGVKIRDITVSCIDASHGERVAAAVGAIEGVTVDDVFDRTFQLHHGGKIQVDVDRPVEDSRRSLDGLHAGCGTDLLGDRTTTSAERWDLTIKGNTVAVITDGTAVLGLGDIGAEAALPVMEGKALLFKEFAGVDACPLCLGTTDVERDRRRSYGRWRPPSAPSTSRTSPRRAASRSSSVCAPTLDIPVFHDDQHGTAIVVLAALLNSLRLVGKRVQDTRIVVTGAGAAGMACTNIILAEGATNIIVCDVDGALYSGRPGLDRERAALAEHTNPGREQGMASDLLAGADAYIGVSGPGAVSPAAVRTMAPGAIVFAMANPHPRGAAGRRRRPRSGHSHRTIRLPEPDQQRARISRRLPRCAGRPRKHDQRGDEACRGPGDRRGRLGRRARCRVHHPERVQPQCRACGRGGRRGSGADEWRRQTPLAAPPIS